jgi:selenocysteine lyase/cysteine desulfurase
MTTTNESLTTPDWVDAARRETPGVGDVVHLNNAGAALPPAPVLDTMIDHLRREAQIGGYEAADEAAERVDAVYTSLAALISAHPSQIAVVENATRAWDMAVYGYPFKPGDRVLTARAEYASNAIALLHLANKHGIEIVLIEDDEHGQISLDHLRDELAIGAAMMSLVHMPTNGGLINPAREVGVLCREFDTFYVLDACQSVGQVPIDVDDLACDVLSTTGRKYLRGPRGTGFLYVSDKAMAVLEPPFLDLHAATWTASGTYTIRDDARRFENWETNHAAKLALGAAADYALGIGLKPISHRIGALASHLRTQLADIAGVTVHDKGAHKSGIITFTVDDHDPAAVQSALAQARINTNTTRPDYAWYDQPHRSLGTLNRASVHYYNTHEEIEQLITETNRLLRG